MKFEGNIKIRETQASDESRWRELWEGYNRFYKREPSNPVTTHLWRRLMSPTTPVYSILAENEKGLVVGISNYLLHENTSTLSPVCYLQDIFVDPEFRGHGTGRKMIDWLLLQTKKQKWARLYWHTSEGNYRARGLYDKFTPHSGFLLYTIKNLEL